VVFLSDSTNYKLKVIDHLKKTGVIKSEKVEKALLAVPREEFVPEPLKDKAYVDTPLPIGHGQTISAIHMVAIMVEALDLKPGLKVLEVGAGSGYHAAVCAEIIAPKDAKIKGHVYSVERISELAELARKNLEKAGYSDRVTVIVGDGTCGYHENAPYDRILVTAAGPKIPEPLLEQLKVGGILLIPIGGKGLWQELILVKKHKDKIEKSSLGGVAFVPLIGKYGWNGD